MQQTIAKKKEEEKSMYVRIFDGPMVRGKVHERGGKGKFSALKNNNKQTGERARAREPECKRKD